jgi:hypothetical protein
MTVTTGELPVLHGYIREHLFMTAREHADLVARFVVYAKREGYSLGKVFQRRSRPRSRRSERWFKP